MNRLPFLAPLVCLMLAGCGGDRRQSVAGTVTVDGQPVEYGVIEFRPQSGTSGPTSGSPIESGEYEITSNRGPFEGNFRVEIRAMRASGGMVADAATGELSEAREQYLPAEYNTKSTLTVEVSSDSDRYDFELELAR